MKTILKWLGIVLGGLVGLLFIAALSIYFISEGRLNKPYTIPASGITVPTDAATIAYGKHLVEAVGGCTGCHGENLGGALVFDEPIIGTVYSLNLTSGQGGLGSAFTDEDFVRAIRHGVRPDGTPALIMPSNAFYYFSDQDLAAIIAYVKSVPPVDNETPKPRIGPMGRVLLVLGQLQVLPAERIDHSAPRSTAPAAGISVEYGEYLAKSIGCNDCHADNLAGGAVPGAQPGDPLAPNLTPGGELRGWSETDFFTALRSSITPTGRKFTGDMPPEYGRMTDDELKALWLYLQSLPALETNP